MRKQTKSRFDDKCARLKRRVNIFKRKYPDMAQNYYPDKVVSLFERYIEVYGHAYCMDVKSERRKIAKMLYGLLCELKT